MLWSEQQLCASVAVELVRAHLETAVERRAVLTRRVDCPHGGGNRKKKRV